MSGTIVFLRPLGLRLPDFSPALLDRFLVLIEDNEIEPIIVVTKMDL
ncbi:GTPase RsgA, partial [Peribacillus sp.]